jgi:hypothetical protein
MRHKIARIAFVATAWTAILFGASLPATATTWSGSVNAYSSGGASVPQTPVTGPGTVTQTFSGSGSSANATVTGTGTPSVSASASSIGESASPVASGREELTYQIEILGSGNATVPLNFSGTGGVKATTLGTASLEFTINNIQYINLQTAGSNLDAITTTALSLGYNPSSFSYSGTVNEADNTPITITMLVLANSETCCSSTDSESAMASLDPYFFLSPSYASNYSIEVLTDGIGNGPAAGAPGPIAGAGLPGLIFASGGFLAWQEAGGFRFSCSRLIETANLIFEGPPRAGRVRTRQVR